YAVESQIDPPGRRVSPGRGGGAEPCSGAGRPGVGRAGAGRTVADGALGRAPWKRQAAPTPEREFRRGNGSQSATFRPGWGSRRYGNPGPGQHGSGSGRGFAAGRKTG